MEVVAEKHGAQNCSSTLLNSLTRFFCFVQSTPPPLSFPTPGKTVPHHPLGAAPPPYTHICRHRNCSIK